MIAPVTTLRDLSVVVLDAQATGASPTHGALLEIAHVVTAAKQGARAPVEIEAHWVELPPKTRVSRIVRELTGYTDADARDAIAPEEAWRALSAAATRARIDPLGPSPTIVHFAQFETPFLYDLHARFRLGDEPFPLEIVCAHAVARRLYPDLPRLNLRALAGFLGHTTPVERRAREHVLATAHVWSTLVDRLEELGVVTWAELVAYLGATPARRSKRVFPMEKAVRSALPHLPGVYRFKRSNGDILYVGKATSLKKRIAGHFNAAKRAPLRSQEMLTQALAIDFTVTPTPLEAALLEVDEIKAIDPPYNVHLRDRHAWFVNAGLDACSETRDAAHPLGPLPAPHATFGLGAVWLHRQTGDVSASTRSRAMQMPVAFAPDEPMFLLGIDAFTRQHLLRPPRSSRDIELVRLGFTLSVSVDEDPETATVDPRVWNPARVVRHIARSVAAGVRLLARARWLTILADARVEIEDGAHRFFEVRGGSIEAHDESPSSASVELGPWSARQSAFDGAGYDRLRVFNTELRRIVSEGGLVRVTIVRGSKSLVLSGPRLFALLART